MIPLEIPYRWLGSLNLGFIDNKQIFLTLTHTHTEAVSKILLQTYVKS